MRASKVRGEPPPEESEPNRNHGDKKDFKKC